jgi:parvulin-like peptidyl-prolyl isomerase
MPILVNNQSVDDELIRAEARLLRERIRRETPGPVDELKVELQAREWARENVIMRVLLQQAAGGEVPDELIKRLMAQVPRPSESAKKAYYQQFPALFQRPEMVRASHIVKNVDETCGDQAAEAAMREIENRLQRGVAFARLADLCSDCPGGGGDVGFFARGEMVPEFEDVVFALRLGEISGVFRSPFGWHIARLTERRKAGLAPWREVREQIELELWREKKQQAADDFMASLRARADIRKI